MRVLERGASPAPGFLGLAPFRPHLGRFPLLRRLAGLGESTSLTILPLARDAEPLSSTHDCFLGAWVELLVL